MRLSLLSKLEVQNWFKFLKVFWADFKNWQNYLNENCGKNLFQAKRN
jgi:hypothetical protein